MTDPPLLPLLTGPLQRRGRRVVHWTMDLYPGVAGALGVLPEPLVGAVGRPIRRARRRADAVVAIGQCMASRLRAQGVPDTVVVPNWSLPGLGADPEGASAFRQRHDLGGFVVMYSGTLGLAHPSSGLLGAAPRLAEGGVTLVVVGGGTCGRERAESRGVQWIPPVERGALSASLGAADAHVVIQDNRTLGMLVPSKVYGAAATGRSVAFLGPPESEAAAIARSTPVDTVIDPADANGISD